MKSAVSIPLETQSIVEPPTNPELNDPHGFESVGDILRRMFAQAGVQAPLSEERK
jgi:hypothetical protein